MLALSGVTLLGCGGVIDEILWDCIDLDGPEIVTTSLPSGTVAQPYSAIVMAEIVREPFDDAYRYDFTIQGQLPSGLEFRTRGHYLEIFGTPNAAGNYGFTVVVSVSAYAATLCWYDTHKQYEISIASPPANP